MINLMSHRLVLYSLWLKIKSTRYNNYRTNRGYQFIFML